MLQLRQSKPEQQLELRKKAPPIDTGKVVVALIQRRRVRLYRWLLILAAFAILGTAAWGILR